MSYTKLTDFASKDALLTGNPSKLVRGTELGAEFDAIEVADALNIKPDNVTAATGKTIPVDADLLTLFDSASTFSLKKLTWANIKATVKTYFDTLYARSGANTDITSLGAVASINGGQLAGMRNRIINASGFVQQRPAGALSTSLTYGTADRMVAWVSAGSGISGSVSATGLSGPASSIGYGITGGSWTSGVAVVGQKIEYRNTLDLNSKTITVSGKVYHNFGGSRNIAIYLRRPTTTADDFSGLTTVMFSNVTAVPDNIATTVTATFTLGATDASKGLLVTFEDVAVNTVSNKFFLVGDFQVELGSVATPFEQRPYGMELALCKRYYHVIRGGPGGADYRGVGMGLAANSVNVIMDFMFPTPMRIGPTVSASTLACYDGSTLVTTSSINNYFAGTDSVYMTFIVNSGLVTGRCVDVHTGPASTSFLALDAEM